MSNLSISIDPRLCLSCNQTRTQGDFINDRGAPMAHCIYCESKLGMRIRMWQVQMQVITTRDGWTSSRGTPTFFILAMNADHAWAQGKNVTLAADYNSATTKVKLSGTVAIAKPVANGEFGALYDLVDVDGEGYKSFVEDIV